MKTCPKDNNVEWKVFTLLGNDSVLRERFHSISCNCNVRRVQTFQIPGVWNEILGKREKVLGREVPSTTRLQPRARSHVEKPEYNHNSDQRTVIWCQDFMILFRSGRIDITQGSLVESSVGSQDRLRN